MVRNRKPIKGKRIHTKQIITQECRDTKIRVEEVWNTFGRMVPWTLRNIAIKLYTSDNQVERAHGTILTWIITGIHQATFSNHHVSHFFQNVLVLMNTDTVEKCCCDVLRERANYVIPQSKKAADDSTNVIVQKIKDGKIDRDIELMKNIINGVETIDVEERNTDVRVNTHNTPRWTSNEDLVNRKTWNTKNHDWETENDKTYRDTTDMRFHTRDWTLDNVRNLNTDRWNTKTNRDTWNRENTLNSNEWKTWNTRDNNDNDRTNRDRTDTTHNRRDWTLDNVRNLKTDRWNTKTNRDTWNRDNTLNSDEWKTWNTRVHNWNNDNDRVNRDTTDTRYRTWDWTRPWNTNTNRNTWNYENTFNSGEWTSNTRPITYDTITRNWNTDQRNQWTKNLRDISRPWNTNEFNADNVRNVNWMRNNRNTDRWNRWDHDDKDDYRRTTDGMVNTDNTRTHNWWNTVNDDTTTWDNSRGTTVNKNRGGWWNFDDVNDSTERDRDTTNRNRQNTVTWHITI